MRTFILTLAVIAGVLIIPAVHAGNAASPEMALGAVVLDAHAVQDKPIINIEVNKPGGGDRIWYTNPLWIAVGVLGLLVLVALVVMAAKGGGTTIVKG